jgi:hypothetical protein
MAGVLNTTLCDKVCQCRWFSPVTPVSSNNKTDFYSMAEILLKVALKTITPNPGSERGDNRQIKLSFQQPSIHYHKLLL